MRANEPGNLFYQLIKSRTEPTYKVLEVYTDQDAAAHHGQTTTSRPSARRSAPAWPAARTSSCSTGCDRAGRAGLTRPALALVWGSPRSAIQRRGSPTT